MCIRLNGKAEKFVSKTAFQLRSSAGHVVLGKQSGLPKACCFLLRLLPEFIWKSSREISISTPLMLALLTSCVCLRFTLEGKSLMESTPLWVCFSRKPARSHARSFLFPKSIRKLLQARVCMRWNFQGFDEASTRVYHVHREVAWRGTCYHSLGNVLNIN